MAQLWGLIIILLMRKCQRPVCRVLGQHTGYSLTYFSPTTFHLVPIHTFNSAYYHNIKLSFPQRIPCKTPEKDLQKIEFHPSGVI